MKKLAIFVLILIIAIMLPLLLFPRSKTINNVTRVVNTPTVTKEIDIKANFKIVTNGTTRIFSDSKYHNLSNNVYITSENPSVIVINKENITWSDFFKTLPMSLDKNCLITGTKQTFCTNENKKLYFYINEIETADALDKEIDEDDILLIEYK